MSFGPSLTKEALLAMLADCGFLSAKEPFCPADVNAEYDTVADAGPSVLPDPCCPGQAIVEKWTNGVILGFTLADCSVKHLFLKLCPGDPTVVESDSDSAADVADAADGLNPGSFVWFGGTQEDPDFMWVVLDDGSTMNIESPGPLSGPLDPCDIILGCDAFTRHVIDPFDGSTIPTAPLPAPAASNEPIDLSFTRTSTDLPSSTIVSLVS